MSGFLVNVADLAHRPGARRHEWIRGRLGGFRVVGSAVPAGSEVVVDALLESVSDGILATGTVTGPWRAECRRCLAAVAGEVTVPFTELYEEHPRDGESYPLRHDHIDLAVLAREALLLELPLAPLCAEGCRGLCPQCGADRNQTSCQCAVEEADPRWAALEGLRLDVEGN